MKRRGLLVATMLLLATVPAAAQINPFQSTRRGPRLSEADLDRLMSSVNQLNRASNVRVGATDNWSNPATGSHGTTSVERIFRENGMTCHLLHHEVFPRGQTPPNRYDLTWCLTPQGEWKILK